MIVIVDVGVDVDVVLAAAAAHSSSSSIFHPSVESIDESNQSIGFVQESKKRINTIEKKKNIDKE